MVCAPFDLLRVTSYGDGIRALLEYGEDAKIIAGGQSLGPMLALRLARPSMLVDINDVGEGAPSLDGDVLRVPALTRQRTVAESPLVAEYAPLLGHCVRHIGNVRVRNRGTIGGSLAHGDPTAEIACAALALDARLVVHGPDGERVVPAREFFVSYLTTVLEPAELVVEVRFPVMRPGQGWSFHEMTRRVSDFAVVAIAATVELDPDGGAVRSVDAALAGVADRPVRGRPEALAALVGSAGSPTEIAAAAGALAETTDPGSDVHASGAYRRRLVEVLGRRALGEAVARARQAVLGA
ncbi:FAD binding domain-containing protein [Pseudonocardia acaciae]|uniref:FAD binding domain-containing protein n=1 Tax=Pseudonocardia acaciae TaxID=551276 RepID=UPI00048ADCB8|nr:xanthine dehydrogenase family protein subunit M [Pseudonocardia acaciae]